MILHQALSLSRETKHVQAVLQAGLTCGALDITAALIVYGALGMPPLRLLQGIASGLLGARAAAEGGVPTAMLGLACHFFIALSAATVYYLASRWIGFMVEHAAISGVIYAVAVYFFMQKVVLPLSAAAPRTNSLKLMLIGVVIHIFCVGLPISLTIRWYSI